MKHKLARRATKEYLDEVNDLHKSTTKHRLTQAMIKYKPQSLMLSELKKTQKLGEHMIFSMDNPSHGQHDENAHPNMLSQLKSIGADVHEAQGKYGKPERSIIVRSPSEQIRNHIVSSAHANGQDSIILSNGNEHKMVYLNGPHAGMHHAGTGTEYHQQEPEDFYTKMSNGTMFSHNFDFDKLHKAGVVSPPKGMNLKQMTQIKQDNYVGANGKDYASGELDEGIVRAKTNLAAKMKLAPPEVNTSNKAPSFPPPMPMKKAEKAPKYGETVWHKRYGQGKVFKHHDNHSTDVRFDKDSKPGEYTHTTRINAQDLTGYSHLSHPDQVEVKKADKPKFDMATEVANTMAQLKAHKERHAAMMAQPKPQPVQAAAVVAPQPAKPTNFSQLENLTAPVYVNIHQHRSASRNNIPNPVSRIQHLDDVHKLNQYHGKDIVESVGNTPAPSWGHETYRVNPDKSMHLMDSHYDSSDSRTGRR